MMTGLVVHHHNTRHSNDFSKVKITNFPSSKLLRLFSMLYITYVNTVFHQKNIFVAICLRYSDIMAGLVVHHHNTRHSNYPHIPQHSSRMVVSSFIHNAPEI